MASPATIAAAARVLVSKHQKSQAKLSGVFAAYAAAVARQWTEGQISDEKFVATWIALERAGHDTSTKRAAAFVDSYRSIQDGRDRHGSIVTDVFDATAPVSASQALMAMASESPRAADVIIGRMATGVSRRVLNAGRDTVEWSAAASGRAWRRVTDADPCPFCAMLATRSDYASRESALVVGGGARRHRRHTKRSLGSSYHDHCCCTAVEVVGPWEPTDAEVAMHETYVDASRVVVNDGKPATTVNVLAAMREAMASH